VNSSLLPAVLFDRDGVLNRARVCDGKPYPPQTLEEFEIVDGAREDLNRLKALGFVLVVVTNQPDIARGTQRESVVERMHERLLLELPVDAVLVCPHDDEDNCDCRKPLPGLLFRAAQQYGIDLQKSFVVGDRWRDIDAGYAAGCSTILIDYDYDERGPSHGASFRVSSLKEAVACILKSTAHRRAHERG
jgi:D-glycero-D-manno-heptose 1,7-bisphosphate phosphatase